MVSRYAQLGIDAGKHKVRSIFKDKIHNEYPGAFINIATDPDLPNHVFTSHADGDGSKIIQRLLDFNVTGNIDVIRGAADDAFQMNYGDVAAGGFVDGLMVFNDVIDICSIPTLIPKEAILEQIGERLVELILLHEAYGYTKNYFMGGETADLPDNARNMIFNLMVFARTKKVNVITCNVQPGDAIYGFASDKKAKWEKKPNSGIGANGLTQGRTDTMHSDYTETYPHLWGKNPYVGRYKVTDTPAVLGGMTVSEALISPTRQYSILIRILIDTLKERGIFDQLHAISMNTGGGATKVAHLGIGGIVYEKVMPTPPPIFQLIQQEPVETPWKDMFETFNCGVGLDVVGENTPELKKAIEHVQKITKVKSFRLGTCYANTGKKNTVVLNTPYGRFDDY
jgi:phosphoribosylformylglycinamidine cyclo-ligase